MLRIVAEEQSLGYPACVPNSPRYARCTHTVVDVLVDMSESRMAHAVASRNDIMNRACNIRNEANSHETNGYLLLCGEQMTPGTRSMT